MQQLTVVAFTHKTISLNDLSRFFLHEENHDERLQKLKALCGISELLYISTCNRIEFVFTHSVSTDKNFLKGFFKNFREDWNEEEISFAVNHAQLFENDEAIRHLMNVACSLDSMVIGEREIITQVRSAYDRCKGAGLTGDSLRLVIKNVITTAKQVFTETGIAENPVSVVSLAFRKLRSKNIPVNARVIVIGAGETNSNLLKYLQKHGFRNFSIFNRTLSKAEALAKTYADDRHGVSAFSLDELSNFKNGFDVLVSCTSSPKAIVTTTLYKKLLHGDVNEKVIIDLALPADIDKEVTEKFPVHYIGLNELKREAENNLKEREAEMDQALQVIEEGMDEFRSQFRHRRVELKMREVPEKIRAIKMKAVNDIFARDIESMDETSKEVLSKILDYMEKKCISVPMVMAKEIILETNS